MTVSDVNHTWPVPQTGAGSAAARFLRRRPGFAVLLAVYVCAACCATSIATISVAVIMLLATAIRFVLAVRTDLRRG